MSDTFFDPSGTYQRIDDDSPLPDRRRPAPPLAKANEKTHLLRAERNLFRSLRGSPSPSRPEQLSSQGGSGEDAPDGCIDLDMETDNSSRTLGTFQGVFAPVSLSMLSSILFLRIGYIVGNAGFLETILQLVIAYSILVATVLSICAIATNGAVEGGGVYFMISRTLGMEFGGAIGILFYFANVVSSALYLTACTEGLLGSFGDVKGTLIKALPESEWMNFTYSSLFNSLNLGVCLVGSKLFGKTTSIVFVVVIACTMMTSVSFFLDNEYEVNFIYNATHDCIPPTDNVSEPNCTKSATGQFVGFAATDAATVGNFFTDNLYPKFEFDCSDPAAEVNFFTVFGVLFSGVTGIMAGANMSGELKSPGKNIPRGTLSACLFTFAIFLFLSFLTALTCNPILLEHDCMYMNDLIFWTPIVTVGVLLATFSASLNNLIGASRVLEAVAKDVMFGPILAFVTKGTVKDNPVAAVFFTWFFVELFLLMGSLNTIAQLSSVLFLLCYSSVNMACLGLNWAAAPNFRPSFRYYSWQTCLIGLMGTATMMFFISPLLSAVSVLLCLSLVFALNFLSPIRKQNWGSISQALLFHQVRKYLLLLDPRKAHVKFWRPQILLLVSNPRTSCSLIDFVNTLKKGGLYVIGHVYEDQLKDLEQDPCVVHQNHWLSLIDHLKIKAFVELTLSSSLREGIQHLVRISGIGAMKPNTIVMGYLDESFHGDDFTSPYSPFATPQFEGLFPPLRQTAQVEGNQEPLSLHSQARIRFNKVEFIGTICDILKMQKNVCISRHFQLLNKGTLFKPDRESIFGTRIKKKLFLDVWLVDFFAANDTDITDTTSLFLLQLACIVNMVPRWKKLTVRVFVTAKDSNPETHEAQKQIVQHMLELLRIKAVPHVLQWTPDHHGGELESPSSGNNPHLTDQNYLRSANETVRRRSADTAVTFLYLPLPPGGEEEGEKYLDALSVLTDHWSPTLLVRGVSPVTSITL